MYTIIEGGVKRSDGACIPNNPNNKDWRKYQKWLAAGNTPNPEFTKDELINRKRIEVYEECKKRV